jgi:hypothetical protein
MASTTPAPALDPSLAALTLADGGGSDEGGSGGDGDTSTLLDMPQALPGLCGGSSRSSTSSSTAAAAAAALAPTTRPADVDISRRVVARWRAFVAQRTACPLLDLIQTDFFQKEVLERLDPMDRTMLAQVGRPWLAAVLASGLPRMPTFARLRLEEFCTSGVRLAWAKANGCRWAGAYYTRSLQSST